MIWDEEYSGDLTGYLRFGNIQIPYILVSHLGKVVIWSKNIQIPVKSVIEAMGIHNPSWREAATVATPSLTIPGQPTIYKFPCAQALPQAQ